jgi:hypothetical protein
VKNGLTVLRISPTISATNVRSSPCAPWVAAGQNLVDAAARRRQHARLRGGADAAGGQQLPQLAFAVAKLGLLGAQLDQAPTTDIGGHERRKSRRCCVGGCVPEGRRAGRVGEVRSDQLWFASEILVRPRRCRFVCWPGLTCSQSLDLLAAATAASALCSSPAPSTTKQSSGPQLADERRIVIP